MNLEAMKRAVARWETYEDRGITPHKGWGQGGDGNSCALGDIAHYEDIEVQGSYFEQMVGTVLGMPTFSVGEVILGINFIDNELEFGIVRPSDALPGYNDSWAFMLSNINDVENRWPIAEVKRLIQWEEAARVIDVAETPVLMA